MFLLMTTKMDDAILIFLVGIEMGGFWNWMSENNEKLLEVFWAKVFSDILN